MAISSKVTGLIIGLGFAVSNPSFAQTNNQAQSSDLCRLQGSQYNPVCSGQRDQGEQQAPRAFREFQQVGPLGPVESTRLPRGADSVIALVPERLQQVNAPPMWVRVCRTNSNDGNGASNYMWLRTDGETVRLVYPRCVYAAFQTRVTIGTVGNDEATVEFQFLGRR